uniref:Uncharacterized protein n=1 Tax=viral metagenome TaxID=1070528 RepID=A0A6C0AEN4_9ZZZZ
MNKFVRNKSIKKMNKFVKNKSIKNEFSTISVSTLYVLTIIPAAVFSSFNFYKKHEWNMKRHVDYSYTTSPTLRSIKYVLGGIALGCIWPVIPFRFFVYWNDKRINPESTHDDFWL